MSASQITPLGFALLGLVNHQPRTGYALRKVFETTPMGHYSSSPGAIYPALRRLEGLGLIDGHVDDTHALRPRRVYRITEVGLKALRAWVSQPVTRDEVVWRENELMLRFGFMGSVVPASVACRFLDELARELDARVVELREYRASMPDTWSLHGRLAVEAGIEHTRGWARWARRAAKELAAQPARRPQ